MATRAGRPGYCSLAGSLLSSCDVPGPTTLGRRTRAPRPAGQVLESALTVCLKGAFLVALTLTTDPPTERVAVDGIGLRDAGVGVALDVVRTAQPDRTHSRKQRDADVVVMEMPAADADSASSGSVSAMKPVGEHPQGGERRGECRPRQHRRLFDGVEALAELVAQPGPPARRSRRFSANLFGADMAVIRNLGVHL